MGSYRGAAEMCGTTHKTVKRIVEAHEAGPVSSRPSGRPRATTTTGWPTWSRSGSQKTHGRISAKRLLPAARAAGYAGSPRNFRRLVAEAKRQWRRDHHRGRRPGVWLPGETLIIDWGCEDGLHVFCAVLAWSRFRFVRFADNEKRGHHAAICWPSVSRSLGGVPQVVLADRMGCLKAGMVANVVVPTADYVRFATHYGFRPDFCDGADPESKGMVEHLVGYAKTRPDRPAAAVRRPGRAANDAAAAWCARGQRRHAFRDLRGSRRAAGRLSGSCCGRCRRCGPRSG